jgi:hypothetical protein
MVVGLERVVFCASTTSRPWTVRAQITKINTAMNKIAHTVYQGSQANATSAHNSWLAEYNHDRYHTAIDGPPINRANNLTE